MKSFLASTIISILLSSCGTQTSKGFDRQNEVNQFLKEQNISFSTSDGIAFIINNKNCNTCIQDLLEDVFFTFKNNTKPKLFLLTKWDTTLTRQIASLQNVNKIVIDSLNNLQRYGLDYGDDLILQFQNGKVKKWTEISNYTLNKIKEIADD